MTSVSLLQLESNSKISRNDPYFRQFESWLTNPKFHVFNHANTVLVIYGNAESHWHVY